MRCCCALAVLAGFACFALSACGGDSNDDLSDIKATATAAAQSRTATPTVDAASAYREDVARLGSEVHDSVQRLTADLLAAQASQGDPKWPGVLGADCDDLATRATALANVNEPGSVPSVLTSGVEGAAISISSSATLLKQAVQNADADLAARAVQQMQDSETTLEGLLPQVAGS